MIDYETCIISALIAIAWIMVITGSGGLLGFLPKKWKAIFGENKLSHVLFDCSKCFSAWVYIGLHFVFYDYVDITFFVQLFITISLTFYLELIANKLNRL